MNYTIKIKSQKGMYITTVKYLCLFLSIISSYSHLILKVCMCTPHLKVKIGSAKKGLLFPSIKLTCIYHSLEVLIDITSI